MKETNLAYRWKQYSKQEKIVLPLFHLLLLILAAYMVLPLLFAILNSFKSIEAYYQNSMAFPAWSEIKWSNYVNALHLTYRNTSVLGMFGNTIYFVVTFCIGNVGSSMCCAYVLSRFQFRGRNFLYALAITIQIIPVFGTTGAAYMVMDDYDLIDNIWMIWITGASGFDYMFLIFYSYFVNVAGTYAEAAEIDGAGNFRIFWQIMVPMVLPAVFTMILSTVMGLWNDYATALLYLPSHPTLATGIYNLKSLAAYQEGGLTTYFAAIVIAMIPILLMFFFGQVRILKINVDGGVKG